MICRGARNIQLRYLCAIGFLDSPTDDAWEKKRIKLKRRKLL